MTEHEKFAEDLPLLAVGALDDAERGAVEAHLRSCDECSREFQRLNGDLAGLALATPLEQPPVRARARLLSAIAKEPKGMAQPSKVSGWLGWAVAAVMAVLALVAWVQMARQREEIATEHRTSQQAAELVHLLTAPDAQRFTLVAANEKPQPQLKAIYSPKSGGLVFFASNCPQIPAEKAYELWLIPEQGAPMPAGVFRPDARGSATMVMMPVAKDVQAKTFAVTVEPVGGSKTPTMPIVFAGQTS